MEHTKTHPGLVAALTSLLTGSEQPTPAEVRQSGWSALLEQVPALVGGLPAGQYTVQAELEQAPAVQARVPVRRWGLDQVSYMLVDGRAALELDYGNSEGGSAGTPVYVLPT